MSAPGLQQCFIVEGNIGAGKSTFLKIVKAHLNVQIVLEPLRLWRREVNGENLFDKFYKDTPRWAYTFQTYAFLTRVMDQQAHAKNNPYMIQILERSVFSDRYCFAKNCYEQGYMNALEWKLYQEWFSWLIDTYVGRPSGFIYLRTDPEVCYQRLIKRNRKEEVGVSQDYLRQLHENHEQWLLHKEGVAEYLNDTPVLTLNCNPDFEKNKKEQEKHIEEIVSFISLQIPDKLVKSSVSSLGL